MIGRTLAHYEILSLLGRGGMGEVYRARDIRLGREVALKVLPPGLAGDPGRLERFEREARTLAGVSHPNIVHLYSVEEAEGIRFLTMELVEGRSLDQVLEAGGLPLRQILSIGSSIADALAAAHAKGIVHRDLKPANVLVTSEGHVKVLDFGLAKLTGAGTGTGGDDARTQALFLTGDGAILGTVPYMSPEQLRGREVDSRSDIFSLGILLYELATGRRPFRGESLADISSAILQEVPAPLGRISPECPEPLTRLVARCLEKAPEDRIQSAAGVAGELRALQRETEAGAMASSPERSTSMRPVSNRALVGFLAALAVLAAVSLGAWGLKRNHEPPPVKTRTLAVLPFTNLSPDTADAFFTSGVHEDVMDKLARLGGLRVISRRSVLAYAGSELGSPEIGKRLGAAYLVAGTVRRSGNRVKVTAQLIEAATDQILWSDGWERSLDDVFAVQAEIASNIASTLQMTLTPGERAQLQRRPTVVVAAYDDYLRARDLLNRSRVPPENLNKAIGYLQQATAADPAFLDGWALLCEALTSRTLRLRQLDDRQADADASARDAEAALARARSLDPEDATTLRAEGVFESGIHDDRVAALRAYDRSLAVRPNDSETLFYESQLLMELGQLDQAVDALERAYALDNNNGRLAFYLTFGYEFSHRYADMVPFLERLQRLEPEETHLAVEAAYYRFLAEGSMEAYRAFEKAVRTVPITEQCDVRSVKNLEMVVAMFDGQFDQYDADWKGKWDAHHRGHGNWMCPAQVNDELNHARLCQEYGDPKEVEPILAMARASTARPYQEMTFCIFKRAAFMPKLDYLSGHPEAARREFEDAVPGILDNDAFPQGPVERSVLLQTADLVAPDRVYTIYRQIVEKPVAFVSLETICADPWTYPNLIRDPRFIAEVRKDGRFVEFLEHFGIIPKQS